MKSMSQEKLTIAISSRALFDLDESHAVFQNEGGMRIITIRLRARRFL